uniref:Uncharacterized protein n=1 Tax=viral metagenome TaxID=1070528 RepID=A0A6M3XZV1_9ZZZZ
MDLSDIIQTLYNFLYTGVVYDKEDYTKTYEVKSVRIVEKHPNIIIVTMEPNNKRFAIMVKELK